MSSDRLMDELVSGLTPVRPRRMWRDALVLAILATVELGLFLLMGAARHDIMLAMTLPSFWWRMASLGALTLIGIATALRSFDPAGSPRRGLAWLAWAIGATLVGGWVVDAAAATGGAALWARLMWRHGVDCAIAMAVLSLPMIVALGLLMRRAAPTDRRGTALAAGLASAAWGGFVFVFNCAHDDPLYIAVWYLVGCGIVTLAGRLVLPLLTRW